MTTSVAVLGAGFGGLELTTLLSESLGDDVAVTLIDQNDSFVFGFSKLEVMFGNAQPEHVRHYYRDIVKPGVEFRQETVRSIDPSSRTVVTDRDTYEVDVLVVALGADLDPGATPGLLEGGGHEFYSVPGAEAARAVIDGFGSGVALVGVLGPFFKCPPAPYETAMMLHDHVSSRGGDADTTIKVLTPLSAPVPISKEVSVGVLDALESRGIEFWPETHIESLEPARKAALLRDGREVAYDLFLAVPVHKAPDVVTASGLTENGWIPVNTDNFATRFPGVYAIGDVTSAPVPRAGVFAEGEAATLAQHLIAQIAGGEEPQPYRGAAVCYFEFGGGQVGSAEVSFLEGPKPKGRFRAPTPEIAAEKREFAATRTSRWFG